MSAARNPTMSSKKSVDKKIKSPQKVDEGDDDRKIVKELKALYSGKWGDALI